MFSLTEVKSTVVFAVVGEGLGLTLFMFIHLQLVPVSPSLYNRCMPDYRIVTRMTRDTSFSHVRNNQPQSVFVVSGDVPGLRDSRKQPYITWALRQR